MRTLVLGATGRTGQRFVERAAHQSHDLVSFGRRAADGVAAAEVGSFGDPAFAELVQSADAVISCLASTNKDPVCTTAAAAVLAAKPGVRFLTIAGAGMDHPDDQKGTSDKIVGAIMRVVARGMLADRQAELSMLQVSQAAWTVLRPPRRVTGKAIGAWGASFERSLVTWIDRDDLARTLLHSIETADHVGNAPCLFAETGASK